MATANEVDVSKLTEHEREICRVVGAKWVTSDSNNPCRVVYLWSRKPITMFRREDVFYCCDDSRIFDEVAVATIKDTLFPSLKPGDYVHLA